MSDAITDGDRYPTLTDAGRRMLERLRTHPRAPVYRNTSGNRLTAEDVESLRGFERDVLAADLVRRPGQAPEWLGAFVARTLADVPFHRALGAPPARFEDLPTTARADLAQDVARFVPDSVATSRLINFTTTGTTGHPLLVPSHPLVAARYLAFHKRALRRVGVELRHGRGEVGVVLVGYQRQCFTYVSVTPAMEESGLAKINLHPADWRQPEDRAAYLDALAPEVYAGDPLSFVELLALPLTTRPRALISVSMALAPALRERLERRFGCPVLDVYSMNEAGPVGVFDAGLGGHLLLQPMLHVEVLDADGRPVPPGARGEITLTGGFNFCLPLLRYRTGDHGSLSFSPEGPVIQGLEGRPPVRFRTAGGEWVNNIDVTHALARLPLPQFQVHQSADASVTVRLHAAAWPLREDVRRALEPLFGRRLAIEPLPEGDKVVQYTSDLAGALP